MPLEISGVGLAAVLLAGTVSFLSPCVLPLVPGYVSFIAGRSLDEMTHQPLLGARLSALGLSLGFVLGFSTVFIALGASASAVGQFLQGYRYEANYVAGTIVTLFGLQMMGILRFGWLSRDLRFAGRVGGGRPMGAYVLGAAFAFGWTPCIGPILGAILTISAVTMSVADGVVLLSIYSAGLAVPFLLVAALMGQLLKWAGRVRWLGGWLHRFAGVVMVVMGAAMVTGYLNSAGTWMLQTFPIFQRLTL